MSVEVIEWDEFVPFPKIPRLRRTTYVTEKIDGTNAQIMVNADATDLRAASRKRLITPEADNFGFARWCEDNKDELLKLGPGRHYGEWWGQGIQRGYGLTEKRFSLFNTSRWLDNPDLPACCSVVPLLVIREDVGEAVKLGLDILATGSVAAPGWSDPEGVVVFMSHANSLFKVTCKNDEAPKGQVGG